MKRSRFWATLVSAFTFSMGAGAVPTKLTAGAGEIRDIVSAGSTMYAATQGGGVYSSPDGGASWGSTPLNTGYVWKLAISSPTSTLYAATDSGLFRTTDSGSTWTQLTFDPARAVAVDPNSGGTRILLGVPGQGLLRSSDSGASWVRESTGLDSADVTSIFIRTTPASEAFIVLNCNSEDSRSPFKEGNWGGVFRSANITSTPISWASYQSAGGASLPSKCVSSIAGAASGTRLLAGIQDPFDGQGDVYKTDGAGWSQVATLFGIESLVASAASATTFHVGTRGVGIFTSTNSGDTWTQKSDYVATDSRLRNRNFAIGTVAGNPAIVVASAKGIGIMRSTNFTAGGVATWTTVIGIRADRVRALDNHRNVAAGTYWMGLEGGGVAKSTNSGASFLPVITGLDLTFSTLDILPTVHAVAADPDNAATVLIGARGFGLHKLAAGGASWDRTGLPASVISTVVDYKPQFLAIPTTGSVFYTLFDGASSVAGGLVRSTAGPGGLTQTNYPADILNCTLSTAQAGATKVVFASGASYLLRHDSSAPYRSTDLFAGNSAPCVNVAHEGYERVTFYDIAQRASTSTVVAATSKGVFRSGDNGVNWARVSVSGLTAQVLSAIAYNGTILYGADRGGRLHCSTDDGTNWQNVSLGGLASVAFRDMKLMNGSLHILTDGGGVYNGFAGTCP